MKSAADWIAELEQGRHSLNARFVRAVQLDALGHLGSPPSPSSLACSVCHGTKRVASYEFSACLYCLPGEP